jgi:RAMP superfamily
MNEAMNNEGYQFAPLPDRVQRAARPQAVHDRRVEGVLSGTIQLVLRAQQPVHVGSGFKELRDDGVVVRRAAEVRGRPGIPGSSLKGVLRSRYEAITRSCAGPAPKGGKVSSRSHREVERASFTHQATQMEVFRPCEDTHSCAACALFGRMSLRSRITVTDFAAEEGTGFAINTMPAQFSPRAHHLGNFDIVDSNQGKEFRISSLKGRKFASGQGPVADSAQRQRVEVIPCDTLLRGELRVLNALPAELGGLLAALGVSPMSALKIGAGKGLAFGRMVVDELGFRLQDHMRAEIHASETVRIVWRHAFLASHDYWKSGEEALIRIHGKGC